MVLSDLPDEHRKPEYIGIVTPYTAQRDCIKERIQGTELEAYCRVGTVHAYQGLEFDILIFDVVESPGLAIAPFFKRRLGIRVHAFAERSRHTCEAQTLYCREHAVCS